MCVCVCVCVCVFRLLLWQVLCTFPIRIKVINVAVFTNTIRKVYTSVSRSLILHTNNILGCTGECRLEALAKCVHCV